MRGKKLSAKERGEKIARDKKERARIFKELCDHVSAGYSLDCFAPLSAPTIQAYFTRYEEFDREEFELSLRKGKQMWEGIGRKQATGECLGNSRSWYYNMANRYGWREKLEVEAEHKGQISVNVVSYATQKASSNEESK